MNIPVVSNEFMDDFNTNFDEEFVAYYKLQNVGKIQSVMNEPSNVVRTGKEYDYQPLHLPENNEYDYSYDNIVMLHSQLKNLTPVEATDPRLWIALENTDFLDYHMRI